MDVKFEHRTFPDVDEIRVEDGQTFTMSDLREFDPVQEVLRDLCEEARETVPDLTGREDPKTRAALDALRVRELVQPELYGLVEEWHDNGVDNPHART